MTAQQAEKESDAVEEKNSELIYKIKRLSIDDRLYVLNYMEEILNDSANGNIYQRRRRDIILTSYC